MAPGQSQIEALIYIISGMSNTIYIVEHVQSILSLTARPVKPPPSV